MNPPENKPVTAALWIPFLWYAIAATRAISAWVMPGRIDLNDVNFLEGSAIDRHAYIVLIVLGLVVLLLRRNVQWSGFLKKNIWLVVLLFYVAVSALWSNFQEVSIKRSFKLFGSVVMALIVVTEPDPLEAIATVIRRLLLLHLPLSILCIKYFRTIGVAWSKDGNYAMWTGITIHKNLLGQVCMTSGIYFLWEMMRKWKNKGVVLMGILYLLMTVFLMTGPGYSKSTTSIFVLLFGIGVLLLVQKTRSNPKVFMKYLTGAVVASLVGFVILTLAVGAFTKKDSLVTATVEASGRDMTFTGRTLLWSDILDAASVHPVRGVGFGSFWIGDLANDLWERHPWKPRQGHNGYIDVYVELGAIGLLLLFAVIASVFNDIRNTLASNFEFGKLRFTFLSMIVIHNVMESSFLRGIHNLWFLFLVVAISVPQPTRVEAASEPESLR